ncbi:2-oxoglutarate dehydrogenase E1 component [Ceratobasidium sp. 395]|nr:2-oxoglutarate dehydrogenase E1 component [Ceratobasidium sp. 395]
MPHRGRLDVLANVVRKPIEAILNKFIDTDDAEDFALGDVKYHLGANYVRPTLSGKRASLSLVANPSHLEAEDLFGLSETRGLQHFEHSGRAHNTAMAVLLHSDAAFVAQGVVYKSMGMSKPPNYGTGGTIHLIVNNRIGFTTDPRFSRPMPHCSDIAKAIDASIFHVNGDDTEAIEKQSVPLPQYRQRLIQEGTFTAQDVRGTGSRCGECSRKRQQRAKSTGPVQKNGCPCPGTASQIRSMDESVHKHIGQAISTMPQGFTAHRDLVQILAARGKSVEQETGIDWATAEALVFGSLILEKIHVCVSGQDFKLGSFSQRHVVIHDQETK